MNRAKKKKKQKTQQHGVYGKKKKLRRKMWNYPVESEGDYTPETSFTIRGPQEIFQVYVLHPQLSYKAVTAMK